MSKPIEDEYAAFKINDIQRDREWLCIFDKYGDGNYIYHCDFVRNKFEEVVGDDGIYCTIELDVDSDGGRHTVFVSYKAKMLIVYVNPKNKLVKCEYEDYEFKIPAVNLQNLEYYSGFLCTDEDVTTESIYYELNDRLEKMSENKEKL